MCRRLRRGDASAGAVKGRRDLDLLVEDEFWYEAEPEVFAAPDGWRLVAGVSIVGSITGLALRTLETY